MFTFMVGLEFKQWVASAAAGGVAAVGGNVPGAVLGIVTGAEKFISAAKKYNENIQYEHDRDNENQSPIDKDNDQDSWDRDY